MEINLVFEVKGKKVSLTNDEARDLYNQLKELYGDNGKRDVGLDDIYRLIHDRKKEEPWDKPPYITYGVSY